jgi:plastocyanin
MPFEEVAVSRPVTRRAVVALTIVASTFWSSRAAVAGGGCMHGSPPSDGAGTTVEMVDACFTPTVLHVAPGAEVTFVNRDEGVAHNVVGVGATWGVFDELSFGERASYRFGANGVYLFSCYLHEGMIGAVVVGDGTGAADLSSVARAGRGVSEADAGAEAVVGVAATGGSNRPGAMPVLLTVLALAGLVGIGLSVRARRRSMSAR